MGNSTWEVEATYATKDGRLYKKLEVETDQFDDALRKGRIKAEELMLHGDVDAQEVEDVEVLGQKSISEERGFSAEQDIDETPGDIPGGKLGALA